MRRLAALLIAAALLIVAAAGLSSVAVDDYCFTRGPAVDETFDGSSSSSIVFWPPGRQCRYETSSGQMITEDLGDVSGFILMLALGSVAVFRRGRYAWASLTALGLAGLLCMEFGFQAMFGALVLGSCLALIMTRSLVATATAGGVLIVGAVPNLWNGTTLGWAILLLLVSLADRRLNMLENRLLRSSLEPRRA